jgi:hypothetical protein
LAYNLLQFLPQALQKWLLARWPEQFLPPTIILKRQKPGWRNEFDDEVRFYRQLEPLQGTVLPRFYGQVWSCQGVTMRRAIILSDVGDAALCEADFPSVDRNHLGELVKGAYGAIAEFGLTQTDPKMENTHLFGGRIVILDLEQFETIPSDEAEEEAQNVADFIMTKWERRQLF